MAVVETVEYLTEFERGREVLVTITRRKGLDTYYNADGTPFQAVSATFMDYGRSGVTTVYTLAPESPPTDEQRAAGYQRIQDTLAHVLEKAGVW